MYSKIKSWRVKNFRNLGDINIDFTQSPIVTLIGENEAGKTSVVKTFSVLGCNGYQSDQKDYIRDGTTGFGICASLEDNTNVFRFKTKDVNQYKIERNGQSLFEVNKIDRGYGTPVEIEKVMGMVIEPETKELLQVRTYEDQLLFVLTKSSENYKVMYNALKVENITKAINNGNKEANEHRKIVNNCEIGIETLENTLKGIKIVNIDNAVKVKNQMKINLDVISKISNIINLINRNNEVSEKLGVLGLLTNAHEIPEVLSYRLSRIDELIRRKNNVQYEISKYTQLNTLSEIGYNHILKLNNLIELKDNLRNKENNLGRLEHLNNARCIEYKPIEELNRLKDLIKQSIVIKEKLNIYRGLGVDIQDKQVININNLFKIQSLIDKNRNLNKDLSEEKDNADNWYDRIKESGAIVTSCPKCGETVVVDSNI